MSKVIVNILLILILQSEIIILNGQEGKLYSAEEKVALVTDRVLYFSGEPILFSASLQYPAQSDISSESSILYCELLTPEGNKITGNKYLIRDEQSSGYLNIPEDIMTGIYYFRAYTRFMRNYGPESYHYTRISIINPYRKEVQTLATGNFTAQDLPVQEIPFSKFDSLRITTDKPVYACGEKVLINIDGNGTDLSQFRDFSISVIPEFSESLKQIILPHYDPVENSGLYFPETQGLTLTGKIYDNSTEKPLLLTWINLSILGKGQDFMARQSDSSGRFMFSLPDYTGFRDLFICSDKVLDANPKILIDNDFCSIPFHIPTNTFTLTEKERETALRMAVNAQLESFFKNINIPDSTKDNSENQAFYGKPNEVLVIDNYIQLPSLEDYFNELPTLVTVKMRQGKKYFRIIGEHEGLKVFNPLVMVDLVAIDNPELILTIQPTEVSRIEIVNQIYVKGDQTYGGIISIISKKGDFAHINLPSSGIFVNYKFLADSVCCSEQGNSSQHEPKTKNTIFWNPKLTFEKNHQIQESFIATDSPGSYLVVLNAINFKGEIFRKTYKFEIFK